MSTEISMNLYFFDLDSLNFIVIKRDENNLDLQSAFVRKVDKNNFVQTVITSYNREVMKNNTL